MTTIIEIPGVIRIEQLPSGALQLWPLGRKETGTGSDGKKSNLRFIEPPAPVLIAAADAARVVAFFKQLECEQDQRQKFEAWISAPPYERHLARFPRDERKYAWPAQYKDVDVQLAWEAWCAAKEAK